MRGADAQEGDGSGTGLDRLVAELGELLGQRDDLSFVYLFGSHAKGRAGQGSDVDLGVVFSSDVEPQATDAPAARALRLEAELEAELGNPVQVVELSSAPPGLVQNVLHTGRLICRPDRAGHARFYVAHANRYFDLAPARAIFDRYRARRIAEGEFGGRTGDRS